MGVWIETLRIGTLVHVLPVTPCVGVWIETLAGNAIGASSQSHPAWVCGLKRQSYFQYGDHSVTPCVGVWIETSGRRSALLDQSSHTLRGCVD